MEHHALVIRHGDLALLDAPAIICRSWHPSEDPNLEGEELELEIALPRARQADVRVLLEVRPRGRVRTHRPNAAARIPGLRDQDLPEYEEHVYNAVARVPTRA